MQNEVDCPSPCYYLPNYLKKIYMLMKMTGPGRTREFSMERELNASIDPDYRKLFVEGDASISVLLELKMFPSQH